MLSIAVAVTCCAATTDVKTAAPGGTMAVKPWTLAERDGRSCLLTPAGRPFLLLGISHVGLAVPKSLAEPERAAGVAQIEANLRAWNFNCAPDPSLWDRLPFIVPIDRLVGGEIKNEKDPASRFEDVFDPAFKARLRARAREACAKARGNPNCIGYWWTDVPPWTPASAKRTLGKTWVEFIRDLPATAPGRKRYGEFIAGPGPRDDIAFLRLIARELYADSAAAFREFDPTRLLFGERYNGLNVPDEVLEEAARVVDVISLQPYEAVYSAEKIAAIHRLTGKPIVISDWNVSFKTETHARTSWPQFPNAAAAAEAYEKYLHAAFSQSFVLGYFKCGYLDKEKDQDVLKQGLVRTDGRPYEEFVSRLKALHARLIAQFVREGRYAP